MALFARGAVRFACALVDGVDLQFGGVPNPIGRSLVRSTPEARALMAAGPSHPERGMAVIEKFASMFPDAGDFFDHWRGQFATKDGEDAESFSAVMRHTLATKDVGQLFTS